jgi:hypothetical protein
VTALCGSEYEWGVPYRLLCGTGPALTINRSRRPSKEEPSIQSGAMRIAYCSPFATSCRRDNDDQNWLALRRSFADQALREMLLLAGYNRTISYVSDALRLPLETLRRAFRLSNSRKSLRRGASVGRRSIMTATTACENVELRVVDTRLDVQQAENGVKQMILAYSLFASGCNTARIHRECLLVMG